MLDVIKSYTQDGNTVSKLGNISSICMEEISGLNWVGFYLYDNDLDVLVLGPFNGKKATSIIETDKGVCGTAFTNDKLTVVDDVHSFCGHIACDLNSNSELVIPLHKDGKVVGVMDIDSPIKSRFDNELVEIFKSIVSFIESNII